MKILAFIRLTRPLFLVGGALLYGLGAVIAWQEGAAFHLLRLIAGQALVTSIQLLTHYTNEYYDLECDRQNANRTWFSGGSGVLVTGDITTRGAQQAMVALAGAALLSLAAAGWLLPRVLLPGLLALTLAWSYSGPPFALVRTGWGEGVASLIVALLVPVVGFSMQAGHLNSPLLWTISIPLVLIHFAMLIAFQIPDREADEAVGKRTLAVRLGEVGAARLHNISLFLAFCVIFMLAFLQIRGAWLARVSLPLAIWQTLHINHIYAGAPHPRVLRHFRLLTLGAIGLFALTSLLFLTGLVLG